MRVVDPGPDPSVVRRHVCTNCGAVLEYVPKDVMISFHHDYDGSSDTYSHIVCPQCQSQQSVNPHRR